METIEEKNDRILKRTLTEPTLIVNPFHHSYSGKDSIWRIPLVFHPAADRQKLFKWDRPRINREELIESAARYQVEQLGKLLRQKDIEIRLLTKQLLRTNEENYDLLKELEGYRGKKYDELYQENIILKHHVIRTSRENVVLAGKIRQDENRSFIAMSNRRPKTSR